MHLKFAIALGALAAASGLPLTAQAQGPVRAAPANDYKQEQNWLCRPGRKDACDIDQSATVVAANGRYSPEPWRRDAKAPVDCFYVYPTASADTTPNSDMIPGPEELSTVNRQLARFGQVCRIYAPIYRQITIPALRAASTSQPMATDRELAYRDVRDAWRHYLAHDNQGRGVVIFGHSQGSGVLKRLIQEEIDGKPVQGKVISALLIGTNVLVPAGKDVGGDFKSMPLCRSKTQTGCIVSYVSFREGAPPPDNTRFARTTAPGMQVACVNPAAPAGGMAVLNSYFGTTSVHPTAAKPPPWVNPMRPISTPFVKTPGLVSGECVANDKGAYLAVRVNADPKDPRTDVIAGDHLSNGQIQKDWGLHSLDVPLTQGDMIALVRSQTGAWKRPR